MTSYNFNQINLTLTASEAFLKRAGKLNSDEYNIVKKFREDYPTMKIVVEKKRKNKNDNKPHLTFKQMESFMQTVDAAKLEQFKKVRAISKVQNSPYHYVKTWFENQFPNYTAQVVFDEDGKMSFVKKTEEDHAAVASAASEDAHGDIAAIETLPLAG